MGKKRVLLDGSALGTGHGAARALRYILPELAQAPDFDALLLTTEHGRSHLGLEVCDTLTVPQMPNSAWEQIGLPWHAKRIGANAVYTFRSIAPTWGPPTLLHFTDEPSDVPPTSAPSLRETLKRAYQQQLLGPGLRRAAMIVTFTDSIAARLRQRYPNSLPRLEVVGLGVDTDTFHPDTEPSEDVIFHLGSDAPRDETVAVVQAYAQALQTTPDLPDLLIGGNLVVAHGPALQAAQAGRVESRVHFLGHVTDQVLRSCFARAAFCLQPSRYEGFGLIPLEAMACGSPVIVRDEPAVREVVGDAGVTVGDSTSRTLADAISLLWSDPPLRARLRCTSLARAQRFTWTTAVQQLRGLLLDLLTEDTEG